MLNKAGALKRQSHTIDLNNIYHTYVYVSYWTLRIVNNQSLVAGDIKDIGYDENFNSCLSI